MNVLGIVAEYNPFHNGHAYQLNECKKSADADYTIVVMSGNFTQRGECAALDKLTRTKMALKGGADLVIELPIHAACSSAGYFADGAVSILAHTGIMTHLGFGSECGDIPLLKKVSEYLADEPDIFAQELRRAQKNGMTYALARQKALEQMMPQAADLLTPNNTLALEYLNTINQKFPNIIPITVKRALTGYHDLSLEHHICSATALRHAADAADVDYSQYMPDAVADIFYEHVNQYQLMKNNLFSDMLYYSLMRMEDFTDIADIDEYLSNRILKLRDQFLDFDSFCALLKSRNYTYTRICRTMYHILFDLTKKSVTSYHELESAPYIRILGFKKSSARLLSAIKQHSDIPMITKPSSARTILNEQAYKIYEENLFADELYRYAFGRLTGHKPAHEFERGIIIV